MPILPERRLHNYTNNGRQQLTDAQCRRYVKTWRKMFQAKDDDDHYEKWKERYLNW